MTTAERERNRALRIARGLARRGEETTARQWYDLAASTWATPKPRQAAAFEDALLEGRRGRQIPGQLRMQTGSEDAG